MDAGASPRRGETFYAVINSTPQEVIRPKSTGALDTTFGDDGRASGTFAATRFASTPSGQSVLSGSGTYRGQTLASSLTRLTPGGAVDLTVVPSPGPTSTSNPAVQADDKAVVLGAGGARAARFNENGPRDAGYVDPGKVPVSLPLAAEGAGKAFPVGEARSGSSSAKLPQVPPCFALRAPGKVRVDF